MAATYWKIIEAFQNLHLWLKFEKERSFVVVAKEGRIDPYNEAKCAATINSFMKNTYYLFQVKFITEYTNVQHIIITQI